MSLAGIGRLRPMAYVPTAPPARSYDAYRELRAQAHEEVAALAWQLEAANRGPLARLAGWLRGRNLPRPGAPWGTGSTGPR
jgi:hypothetical protein